MSEDIIEVCIPIGPISVSVNGLIKRLAGVRDGGPAAVVATRFLSLFGAHGVEIPQIQRLMPSVDLDKLNSPEALLGALSNQVLDSASELFGVRREWLDGVGDQVYRSRTCYKNPGRFFDDLAETAAGTDQFPIRALCSTRELKADGGQPQPIVLLLVKRLAEFGEEEILRYQVYADSWDWGYAPARIQLKATARLAALVIGTPVPLFRIDARTLEDVRAGRLVPRSCVDGCLLTDPSLEDYSLAPHESGQSKEADELPAVFAYIEAMNLAAAADRATGVLGGGPAIPWPKKSDKVL